MLCRIRVARRKRDWQWMLRQEYQCPSGTWYTTTTYPIHWEVGRKLWLNAKDWSAEGECDRKIDHPLNEFPPSNPADPEPRPQFPDSWFDGRPVDYSQMPDQPRLRCQLIAECRRRGARVTFDTCSQTFIVNRR